MLRGGTSVLSEEFLAEVRGMARRNLAVELLGERLFRSARIRAASPVDRAEVLEAVDR